MEMFKITSSNIAEVGYDEDEAVLRILFKNGSIYDYENVPIGEYYGLLEAESAGKYFNKNIARGGFRYKRL